MDGGPVLSTFLNSHKEEQVKFKLSWIKGSECVAIQIPHMYQGFITELCRLKKRDLQTFLQSHISSVSSSDHGWSWIWPGLWAFVLSFVCCFATNAVVVATHWVLNIWNIERAFTDELVSSVSTPSSGFLSSRVYFYPRWQPSTHSALQFTFYTIYIFPILCPIHPHHCANFSTFPSPIRPLPSPHDFPHPCQVFEFSSTGTLEVCDIHVWGEQVDRREQWAIPGFHICCSQRNRWEGAQHSRIAFSQSLWNHGCVRSR